MKGITSISIIGTGNVAFHLGNAFFEKGIQIDFVYSRTKSKAIELASNWKSTATDALTDLNSDLILICISDDAIPEIIAQLPNNISVAYTSGAIGIHEINRPTNIGVFYPLQSFSKNKAVEIFEVPLLIEADSIELAQKLFDLAWTISRKVSFVNSAERKKYHLAAVWVNNFTNHMVYQAKSYLVKENLDFNILLPLLAETADKLKTLDPYAAQTGPAKRNDQHTIHLHEDMLNGISKELYSLISKSITDTYNSHD